MKSDKFISVGISINRNIDIESIIRLHDILLNSYNYFEIIILNYLHNSVYDELLSSHKNIRILELSRSVDTDTGNAAILENCIGDCCALIDLEHDPLDNMLDMLAKAESYDIVIGKRKKKMQNILESLASKIFYKTLDMFLPVRIESNYSNFIVLNRNVINIISKNEDKVKYLKFIYLNTGFNRYEYSYMPIGKKSNEMSFINSINYTIDIIVSYSNRLIRVATLLSLIASIVNFSYILYVIFIYLLKSDVKEGWASSNLFNSSMFLVIFLVLAIVCEYIRIVNLNQNVKSKYQVIDEKSSISLFSKERNIDEQ